jgi:hypothetical protein
MIIVIVQTTGVYLASVGLLSVIVDAFSHKVSDHVSSLDICMFGVGMMMIFCGVFLK